ncbi:MAG: 5-formyltetrahydrofolate cyclo-ligase [Bdellovibrionota bacterium]
MISKKALRKHLQDLRKNQFRRTIVCQSKQITDRLLAFESYQQSQVVGLYDGLDFEVQTENIFLHAISQGKVCLYPKLLVQTLSLGKFLTRKNWKKTSLVCVRPKNHSEQKTVAMFDRALCRRRFVG